MCVFQTSHSKHLTDYLLILSISDYCEFLSVQISLTDASSKEEEKNGVLLANLSSLTMRKNCSCD